MGAATGSATRTPSASVWLRRSAADVVWAIHMGVVALVVTSWMWPARPVWWTMIALAPIMHVQWRLNDGVCVLTLLEDRLRGRAAGASIDATATATKRETFVGRLLEPFTGELSPAAVDRLCYGLLWVSFAACALRLLAF